jgi:hypothetical protein
VVGSAAAKQPESGAVPADNRLGFHDDEGTGPAFPEGAEADPEESVDAVQWRSRVFALQYGDQPAPAHKRQHLHVRKGWRPNPRPV